MTRTRKPRKKATTDLGRSILQRQRQRLAREQAALAEKHASDAARIRSMKKVATKRADNELMRTSAALNRSVVRNAAGVLSSEGVNVPIQITAVNDVDGIDAWTDFNRIHCGYHIFEDDRTTAAVLRGLIYHEGGHCRYTDPWPNIVRAVMSQIVQRENAGEDMQALRDLIGQFTSMQLQHAWNCLEDQRMETAVTSDSPRKAGYFTPMVLRELCDTPDHAAANWPLLVWRRYLPSRIRRASKASFLARHGAKGAGYVARLDEVVTRYVHATDEWTLYAAVLDMAAILKEVTVAADLGKLGHNRQTYRYGQTPDREIPIDPSMEEEGDEGDDEPQPGEPQPGEGRSELLPSEPQASKPSPSEEEGEDDEASGADDKDDEEVSKPVSTSPSKPSKDDDDESDDDEGQAQGQDEGVEDEGEDEDDESDEQQQAVGGTSGKHESDDAGITQEELDRLLAEAEAERNKDTALDKDVQSFHEARDTITSTLDIYVGGVSTNAPDIGLAQNLAQDIKRSFEVATVDKAPCWEEGQKRGILNVNRYVTRQPGDREFFRAYVDEGDPGFDLAVSVLLDYSGSMGGVTTELAQVAYASKVACQELGIPCTVVLWDTDARVLFDAEERADVLPLIQAAGGTDPGVALADLDNHVMGKAKHIVLIMTDDEWSGSAPALSSFQQEGRTIIGLGYSSGYGSATGIIESMERRGADHAYVLDTLLDLPRYLEQALSMSA
jgi:hypothetical protein